MGVLGAPTSTVAPLTATEEPNPSFAAPSEEVSSCCWVQVEPLLTNTYAEPWLGLTLTVVTDAPTTAVVPLTATDQPKLASMTSHETPAHFADRHCASYTWK